MIIVSRSILDEIFVRGLIPKAARPAKSTTLTDRITAGIAPTMLAEQFLKKMDEHSHKDRQNRVYGIVAEAAGTSIKDTGSFTIEGLLEQHPEPIPNDNTPAALLRSVTGWTFCFVGFVSVCLLLLPYEARTTIGLAMNPASKAIFTPLTQLLLLWAGAEAIKSGLVMVKEGERI